MRDPYESPEWTAIMEAIRANLADDVPRLIAADWLEEQGEYKRAEFIRVQLEIARLIALGAHEGVTCNVTGRCAECLRKADVLRLREREYELMKMFATADMASYLSLSKHEILHARATGLICSGLWLELDFRRGFFAEVCCPMEYWTGGICWYCDGQGVLFFGIPESQMGCPGPCHETGRIPAHGPQLVRLGALERVKTTPYPRHSCEHPGWFRWYTLEERRNYDLPACIYQRLVGQQPSDWMNCTQPHYPTADAAMEDLSNACIRWALDQSLPGSSS